MGAERSDLEMATRATAAAVEHRETPVGQSEPPPPNSLASGVVFGGRYEILRPLGRGAMGAVYEAMQHPLERRVAVKVLNPFLANEPEVQRRFAAEGRLASQVRHPNVVEIIDQGVEGTTPYLVMELLEGESLAARMDREGPFDPARALSLLGPVLRALAFVHSRGVVHRDLKPDNLFLARDGDTEDVPRILDLGIAVALDDAARRATASSAMLGTPAYMAPEQVTDARDVTARADQYAMGCVLYEMLTGCLPIEADNLHGVLVAKITQDPTPITVHRPTLSKGVADAVMRAVSRDRAARFPDVGAFLAALNDGLSPAAEAPPAPPAPSAPAPVADPPPTAPLADSAASPAPAVEAPLPPPRRRVLAPLLGALVAVAAVAVAAVLWPRATAPMRPEPPPTASVGPARAPAPEAPAAAVAGPPLAPVAAPAGEPTAAAPAAPSPSPASGRPRGHRPRGPHLRPSAQTPTTTGRLAVDPTNPLRLGLGP